MPTPRRGPIANSLVHQKKNKARLKAPNKRFALARSNSEHQFYPDDTGNTRYVLLLLAKMSRACDTSVKKKKVSTRYYNVECRLQLLICVE